MSYHLKYTEGSMRIKEQITGRWTDPDYSTFQGSKERKGVDNLRSFRYWMTNRGTYLGVKTAES